MFILRKALSGGVLLEVGDESVAQTSSPQPSRYSAGLTLVIGGRGAGLDSGNGVRS